VHPTKVAKNRDRQSLGPADIAGNNAAAGPLAIHLRYAFESSEQHGAALDNPVFGLLAAVIEGGSIRHAAHKLGSSYRHVWGALRKWERVFGEPLITWSQGQRARPTPFAEKLVWAERRARTRMQPHIEALRSDLARIVADARDERNHLLTVRASHDIALPVLQQHVADEADLHLDIGFQGSVDALHSLNARECLVAGFHVPTLCGAAPVFASALKPLLKPKLHRLIACSRRMQGLMVRKEHAGLVSGLSDLARHRLRFVNRQPGSGTRMLVDHLLQTESMDAGSLPGYFEHTEHTHVAVALCVASGVVDAGVGVEAAALQFGLHFIPLLEENYFLACLTANLNQPAIGRLRQVLAGARWRQVLANLPGYRPAEFPGDLLFIEDTLPWWRRARAATTGKKP
jgi:putative molybdopterin biosynthesis protein